MGEEMGGIDRGIDLPACELQRLGEIEDLVTSAHLSDTRKEELVLALINEGYIPKLLQLFRVCEREKNKEGLHLLFDIVRGILYLDKAILYEVMFSDKCIQDVAGCLEYDPCLAQPGQHRESLTKIAKLHEVIPTRDPELKKKIRQVFRAEYIEAILVPNLPIFEDDFLTTLDSFISSRRDEVLEGFRKDRAFLPKLFARLRNEAIAGEQRCALMKILKEFCAFYFVSRKQRDKFLQSLAKLKLLPTIENLMVKDDLQLRSAATDILSYVVEFSPTTVQEFVRQEARQGENATQLIVEIIKLMIYTPDPGFGGDHQLMEIFCALIDPRKMLIKASNLEVFEFLDIFYDRYIRLLIAPLLAHTSGEWREIDNYQTAEILASVLELLSFCVERHKYHMKMYIIKNDLLRGILVLMKSKHKFLATCALRLMRKIIGMKDDLYNAYITLGNLFEPVVNTVLDNRNGCNLLKSASMEMFEFIRKEDIHYLIAHIVENFSDALESLKHIHTFQGLKTKYEQEKERQNEELNSVPSILPGETFVEEEVVSQVDKDLQSSEGDEKAAPMPPPSSDDSCPKYTALTTVEVAPEAGDDFYGNSCCQSGLFEMFAFPDVEDETPPKKRARLDS